MTKYIIRGGKTYIMNKSGTAPARISDAHYLLREEKKEQERLIRKKAKADAHKTPEELDEEEVEYQEWLKNSQQPAIEVYIPPHMKQKIKHEQIKNVTKLFTGPTKKIVSFANTTLKDAIDESEHKPRKVEDRYKDILKRKKKTTKKSKTKRAKKDCGCK